MTTEAQQIPASLIAGHNRRRQALGALHESINQEFYWAQDGWVHVAEGHETHQGQHLIAKGWTPIPNSPRPITPAERNTPTRPPGSQFYPLFEAGMADVFPAEQIISNRWHQSPPIVFVCDIPLNNIRHPEHTADCFRMATFPQLEGVEVFEIICAHCKKYFVTLESRAEVEVQLKKHMQAAHNQHLVNQEITTGLRDALVPVVSQPGIDIATIAEVVNAVLDAREARLVRNEEPTGLVEEEPPPKRGR